MADEKRLAKTDDEQAKEQPKQQSFVMWLIIGIVFGFLTFTILPLLGF